MISALTPGFAEPVGGAQSCFRLVLDAMARPGRVHTVGGVAAPAPLCEAAAAVALTLMDHETPLWLDPEAEASRAWIAFHTGAPIISDPAKAMFALALSHTVMTNRNCLPAGCDEAPETSATVILQVASLTTGTDFVLEGPGLREPATMTVDGLPGDFAGIWQRNHAQYPRGIDLILCAGNQLAALPRSVALREG
jgi:alpha-D-ribose 1-methylphosphonate 5-triphosphate synthase subunit PhnH